MQSEKRNEPEQQPCWYVSILSLRLCGFVQLQRVKIFDERSGYGFASLTKLFSYFMSSHYPWPAFLFLAFAEIFLVL